ncbi:MAG: DUF1476 domain-containing protein [Pseudomonadota bacterium]|nr:DUF1476 domain-containing protein [Pseudomonadota bacterium]
MTQFDDREKAFEKKFELDEEVEFKLSVRSTRLFARWAAGQMGFSAADSEAYEIRLGDSIVVMPGHGHVIAAVERDFAAKGIFLSRHRLEKEMSECEDLARRSADQ